MTSASYGSTQAVENYSLNSVNYDAGGNIKTLSRSGATNTNYTNLGNVDNLTYTYLSNSNKLLKIQEETTTNADVGDFRDGTNTDNDYEYWLDGSLKKDKNKKITSIAYNYLKLPEVITFEDNKTITTEYDAEGTKLKKIVSGGEITDYEENDIYVNGVLYQTSHDEGRIVNSVYEYNITDHLGDLRVAFKDSLGLAVPTQSIFYDPWGLSMKGIQITRNAANLNKFQFLNCETQFETDYIDLVNRQYDPQVGRFLSQDPIIEGQEHLSLYQYGLNNPLRYTDPDGMMAVQVGPGHKFKTSLTAACDFGKTYNDNSIVGKREFGSTIIKTKDFEGNTYFTYTKPNEGNTASVRVTGTFEGEKVGTIHAHGSYDPQYDNNNFSPTDKSNADLRGVPNYVTTPNGSLQKYDPATKGVTILDKSLPSDSNDPARLNNVSVNNLPKNEPTRGVIDAIINYILIPLGQGASAIKN